MPATDITTIAMSGKYGASVRIMTRTVAAQIKTIASNPVITPETMGEGFMDRDSTK